MKHGAGRHLPGGGVNGRQFPDISWNREDPAFLPDLSAPGGGGGHDLPRAE